MTWGWAIILAILLWVIIIFGAVQLWGTIYGS